MPQILVFGASITYGAWDSQGGWVQRLRSYTDKKVLKDPSYYSRIYNLGVSGDTSADLLMRMEQEIIPRARNQEDLLFIISIGANDSRFLNAKGENVTPPEKFKQNIEEVIKISKKHTDKIVFVGVTPADEKKVDPIPWNTERSYLNKNFKEYNAITQLVCQEYNLHFIDVFDNKIWDNLFDGIHPNDQGHEMIFQKVKGYLEEKELI